MNIFDTAHYIFNPLWLLSHSFAFHPSLLGLKKQVTDRCRKIQKLSKHVEFPKYHVNIKNRRKFTQPLLTFAESTHKQ